MLYHLQLFPEGFCDYATPHLYRYFFQSETCNVFIWVTTDTFCLDSFQTELANHSYLHYKYGIGLKSGTRTNNPISGALAITNQSKDFLAGVTQNLELENFPDLQKKIYHLAGGNVLADHALVREERDMLINCRLSDSSHRGTGSTIINKQILSH
jgi:hypothetical protein